MGPRTGRQNAAGAQRDATGVRAGEAGPGGEGVSIPNPEEADRRRQRQRAPDAGYELQKDKGSTDPQLQAVWPGCREGRLSEQKPTSTPVAVTLEDKHGQCQREDVTGGEKGHRRHRQD